MEGTPDEKLDSKGGGDGSSPDPQANVAALTASAASPQPHPASLVPPAASRNARGSTAEASDPPPTIGARLQRSRRSVARVWSELPTACKATMIIACVNFCLSVTYAIVAVTLTVEDEELHITVTILISALFVIVSVADAIIYENTLELATSVVIDSLVLARVIFFAFEGSSHKAFKIVWCSVMLLVQSVYIIVAGMAYREFGWRLYSKLGVDYREKGAADKMRVAILRNSYATLLKVTTMLLLVLCALGIDVSLEKRGGDVLVDLLAVSVAGLFVGGTAIWTAVLLVLKAKPRTYTKKLFWGFHALMTLAFGQPIATIAIYQQTNGDVANAAISLRVSCGVYMVFAAGTWVFTTVMHRRLERDRKVEDTKKSTALSSAMSSGPVSGPSSGFSSMPSTASAAAGDPLLAPMHAGSWIGKPTARSPRKVRFFQLSYDGSTLRWGWNKYVRLYYIDDLACDDAELTMTLAFPFDAELTLKFREASTYHAWRRGLAHLLLMLMAPDARAPTETLEGVPGKPSGVRLLMGSSSSRNFFTPGAGAPLALATGGSVTVGSAAAAAALGGGGEAPISSSRNKHMLAQLGVRVQQFGRRLRPNSNQSLGHTNSGRSDTLASPAADRMRRRSELGSPSEVTSVAQDWEDGEALAIEQAASGSARFVRTSSAAAQQQRQQQQATADKERQEREGSLQAEKRQRMASYLKSLAEAVHPEASRPQRRPPPVGAFAEPRKAAAAAGARTAEAADGGKRRRRRSHSRPSVDAGVQTDESELLLHHSLSAGVPYSSLRRASHDMAPLSSRRLQRLLEEESVPSSGSQGGKETGQGTAAASQDADKYDAEFVSQYFEAMQASGGAASHGTAAAAAPLPPQQQQQQQQQQAAIEQGSGSDAGIAAQYAAAMMAAMGGAGGGGAPVAAANGTHAQQRDAAETSSSGGGTEDQGSAQLAVGTPGGAGPAGPAGPAGIAAQQPQVDSGDGGIAAQYMAAMMAAAAAGAPGGDISSAAASSPQQTPASGISPSGSGFASQQLAALQDASLHGGSSSGLPPLPQVLVASRGTIDGILVPTPQVSTGPFNVAPRRSTSASSPTMASPLEQLAAQQQAAASARLHASLTPGTAPQSQGFTATVGGGLWQLAAAVDVIDYEELSFGKLLGAGAEGAVYAAWLLETPVAVKKFERAEDSLHEVEMYLQLGSHDNVVALRGLCQHEGSMFLVLEYCPRGTLDVMLHHSAKNPWDHSKLLPLVRSIARGMHYLHSRSILHRDLKPANIFVGHGQMMKIGDFGMSRIAATHPDTPPNLRRLTPGTVGTVQYSAPELINEDMRPSTADEMEWALKLDVWSFGVTLWEILARRRPFEGLSQNAVQAQWMSDPYAARLPPVKLPENIDRTGKHIYRGLSDLIEDCTRLDPYARPSSRDILMRLKSLACFAGRKEASPPVGH
ncbi:Mitogen-activated protein kinase kinase kinase dlk-1 [Chlorella vulgaris]